VVGTDEVTEIISCGIEDVYDLQIDRTENFIANGLASHNTRWHEDDLAGRILARPGPLRWRVLNIPAIAEDGDELGRAPGTELQSVRGRQPGYFHLRQATMSRYVFGGIYQQRPTPAEGNLFRRAAFRYWRPMPAWADGRERLDCEGMPVTLADCWRFITMDLAASLKTSADWTVACAWAVAPSGDLILLDRVRERIEESGHYELAEPLMRVWGISQVWAERNWWSRTFTRDAQAAGIPVAPLDADADKLTRAIPAAGRVHAGRVWFPAQAEWIEEWCDELAAFPNAAHDDQVDCLAYAARVVTGEWVPPRGPVRPGRSEADRVLAAAQAAATGGEGLDLMNAALG
jgi:predicted phage terminase large subunit-like protein